MKKFLAIFFVLGICNFANAQFYVNSTNAYLQINNLADIDAVFLFNGITPMTEISYSGAGTKEWREYDGTFISNTNQNDISLSPEDATGYILYINGTPTYWIWVIDYSLYPVSISNLRISPPEQDFCRNLTLTADINAPELVYYDKNSVRKTLTRRFSLDYVDYAFSGENWQDSAATIVVDIPFTQITIPAPKQDVTFTLSGDNFAQQMGIETTSTYLDYRAVAVESHLKGTVEKRGTDPANEIDRDKGTEKNVEGSAPLVVEFKSRANTPVAAYFEWVVYNELTPSSYHRYSDENIRYTFPEDGTYIVKLKVTGISGCVVVDSATVTTVESFLDIPNFFTPNNDGVNDEFRVAYKSLKSYKCVVFNRWGSVVFTSTDPNKGWDGNVRGKPAAAGTYYYVITAVGISPETEGKNKGKPKKWKEAGAVNLFRDYTP